MERIPCCVCEGTAHRRVWAWVTRDEYARRIPEAPARSRWVVCAGCGLVFQNPRPDASEMSQLYSGGTYREWDEVPEKFLEYSRRRARPMLQWLGSLPEIREIRGTAPSGSARETAETSASRSGSTDSDRSSAGRHSSREFRGCVPASGANEGHAQPPAALDLGCGAGGGVKELTEHGWRAFGVEPDPLLARSGTARFGVPIAQAFMHPGLFPEERFRLVFSIHAFEHLLDPLEVARAARSVLVRSAGAPGLLFIAVPTYARATHGAWEWMNTSHTYLFTARSLGNLLARAGFRVRRSLYPEPTYHECSEPSELWLLAEPADPVSAADLPYRESLSRVQGTMLGVPLRWPLAAARRRLRRTLGGKLARASML